MVARRRYGSQRKGFSKIEDILKILLQWSWNLEETENCIMQEIVETTQEQAPWECKRITVVMELASAVETILSIVSRVKRTHICINGEEMLDLVEKGNCSSLKATNFSVK